MSEAQARSARTLVLTGPTASGKKEVGFELARALDAEIVGLDSVKVYRGMRIGAAAPARGESPVPLHLVGVAEPGEPFSVGRWLELALAAVRGIHDRGRAALFLGGTPLYLQALLRGLFRGPPADASIRARHAREAKESGVESLHARLAALDPRAAARILPRDLKRISRALEVHELTGEPISVLQERETSPPLSPPPAVVALALSREALRARVTARVERMFDGGLIEEVRALRDAGRLTGEAALAIGYRETLAHLEGKLSRAAARDETVRSTMRLARKQEQWFRKFPEIVRVERGADESAAELAARVRRAWGIA